MTAALKLAFKELKKHRGYTLLAFAVCIIAMNTVFSAITNATGAVYQKKQFEENIGEDIDIDEILHLHYLENSEEKEFAAVLSDFKSYLKTVDGVTAVGQFDSTSLYFSGIEDMETYKQVNPPQYENSPPELSRVVTVDEELLGLVKGGLKEYSETKSGLTAIYPSEIFKDCIPLGSVLSYKYGDDEIKYEVVGYIPKGSRWVDKNDLIRFPLVSLDGAFLAPYTEESKSNIFTQLVCMQNTYIFVSEGADIENIKNQIHDYTLAHGFEAYAETLGDEYGLYADETRYLTVAQTALAIFISALSLVSVAAVFTTNTLLKRTQYGILIANGFTVSDIVLEISMEIGFITVISAAVMWIFKLIELRFSGNLSISLFRDILLTAHLRFTLPIGAVAAAVLTLISTILPAVTVLKYNPCELIGDESNGNY